MSETTLLLEDDPELGRKVWVTYDETGKPLRALVEQQQVERIVAANKLALDISAGTKFGDYNRVASIPLTLYEKLGMQDAVNARDRKYISKVLNDGDNAAFRTSRGNV